LGEFPFYSGKAERLATAHQCRCTAFFFAMHVTEVLDVWPEAGQRDREWVSGSAGVVAIARAAVGDDGRAAPAALLAAALAAGAAVQWHIVC
jgi:hypothetical protein